MALTATVIKKSVNITQPKLYSINFNLKIYDDATLVIDRDFSAEYHPGDNISAKVARITELMQTAIDDYKAEQNIYNAPALDTAVTSIQNGLIL